MDEEIKLPEPPAELVPALEPATPPVVDEPVADQPVEGEPAADEPAAPDDAEVKKGASARIKELNQQVKSLSERLAEITQPAAMPANQRDYVPQYQPGEEITTERLQTDIAKASDAKIEIRLAQERAVNRINNESLDVIRKYPQLDPSSDSFDKELSDAVVEATEAQVRVNPYTASVSKVVDTLMKPYQRAAQKEVKAATENVAKQVSDAAMRPTSVRQPEKPASEKSLAELEQSLGVVQS